MPQPSDKPVPRSCKPAPTGQVPVIDRNKCEAKEDCVAVCPYDVFEVRALTSAERSGISLKGRFKLRVHGGRQAFVIAPESCHACGLCVTACPERAIKLTPLQRVS